MTKKKQKREFSLKTDLPLHIIAFLALLAIPRVVLHDLRLVDFDSPIYMFFTLAPYAAWIVLAAVRKTKHPFADFLVLGLIFGLMLGATHQILWDGNVPQIGGNLAGQFSPLVESLILRSAAFISSMVTGTIIGVALGAVASLSMHARAKAK